jgi:hypothetical protein
VARVDGHLEQEATSMSFVESFVQCMQNAGVSVNEASVTEQSHFAASVDYLKQWVDSLDSVTKEALDAATTDDHASYLLADAQVAPGVPDLLRDFDNAVGWPLSTLLDWCVHCIQQAEHEAGAGDTAAQAY